MGFIDWNALGGKERILELRRKFTRADDVAEALSEQAGRRISRGAINDYAKRNGWQDEYIKAGQNTTKTTNGSVPKVEELDVVANAQDREIVRLRDQVGILSTKVRRQQKQIVAQHDLADRIAAELVEPLPDPGFNRFKMEGTKERDVILPIYDMQFGSLVRPKDTPHGIGGFNADIFIERARRYVNATINETRDHAASHTEEQFIVVLGGDCVEGANMFDGQNWFLEFDPVEQVIKLADILGHMFHELYGFATEELGVKRTALFCIPGNHGEAHRPSKNGPATFSWDYLLYKILEERLRNYPVDIIGIEPGGSLYFKSQGSTFLAIHGDQFKGWAGIPFYGMQRQDARSLRLTQVMFDYGLVGHHHQQAAIPMGYGEWFMSGNWVGATDFTRKIQASNVPKQAILYNSRNYGVTQTPILLEKRRLPEPTIYLDDEISEGH